MTTNTEEETNQRWQIWCDLMAQFVERWTSVKVFGLRLLTLPYLA